MIFVILGIGLIFLAIGIITYIKNPNYSNRSSAKDILISVCNSIGTVIIISSVIAALILTGYLSMRPVVDDKIAMYQEENAAIEQNIANAIIQYQDYERDTYTELKNESPTILISLFPELKSDTLITKQIDIYVANNQIIKELKEEKLNYAPMAWWLYFGN